MKKQCGNTQLAALITLGYVCVPADSIGHQTIPTTLSASRTSTVTFYVLKHKVVILPIKEAITYMESLVKLMRYRFKFLRDEWHEKAHQSIVINQNTVQRHLVPMNKKIIANINQIINAIREVLSSPNQYDEQINKDIIAFGRSLAAYQYMFEETLNFIKQIHSLKKP
ncbi:MAG TPA: hypothetical protein ACHBZ9_05475 [Arsenophonus nasoniae]|uniref:hypothetical protein n=1 Tax=Arsenophonus nasoniae TaxID=638 RepID=UPI00387A7CF6